MKLSRNTAISSILGLRPLELSPGENAIVAAADIFALERAINDEVKARCSGEDGKLNVSPEKYLALVGKSTAMMVERAKVRVSPIDYVIGLREILQKASH